MADSNTVIAALKCQGGVLIASDSQVSDTAVMVRWPMEKLSQIANQPLVIGFSGSMGRGERARKALNEADFRATTFQKADRVRGVIEEKTKPIYREIREATFPPRFYQTEIALGALGAFWAENDAHIIECEGSSDNCYHVGFHAIGSGGATAYAVFRTLGGPKLTTLTEDKALVALLRIIRTAIHVDMMGVSEPLTVFAITAAGARKLSDGEINANLELVDQWEERERERFFSDAL